MAAAVTQNPVVSRMRWAPHLLAYVVVCVGVGLLIALSSPVGESTITIGTLVAFLIFVCVGAVALERHVVAPFDPLVTGLSMLALLFIARPIRMMTEPSMLEAFHGYSIDGYIDLTLLVVVAGVAAFIFGYRAMRDVASTQSPGTNARHFRASSNAERVLNRKTAWGVVLGAVIVGTTLFVLHLRQGPSVVETLVLTTRGRSARLAQVFRQSSEYLSLGPMLVSSAVSAVLLLGRRLESWERTALLLLALYPTVLFVFVGNRRFAIPALLIPVLCWFVAKNRYPRWSSTFIAVAVLFLLAATLPFVRSAGARADRSAPKLVRDFVTSPLELTDRTLTSFDTEMFPALALQVKTMNERPGVGYYWGQATIGDVLIAPIPTKIWRGKPQTARDGMLIDVFGSPCQPVGGRCTDFSAIGTFYQDLGVFGVVLGMAALGGATGVAGNTLRRQLSAGLVAAVAWIVFLPIILRAGFMPAMSWYAFYALPAVAVAVVASRTRPSRAQVPRS